MRTDVYAVDWGCSKFMNNKGPVVTRNEKQKSASKSKKLAERAVTTTSTGG